MLETNNYCLVELKKMQLHFNLLCDLKAEREENMFVRHHNDK